MRKYLLPFIAAALLGNISHAFAGSGAVIGTLTGAGTGGYIGSLIGHGEGRDVAIGVGIVSGGIIGNEIGSSIDRASYEEPHYYTYGYSPPEFFSDPPPSPFYGMSYAPNYVAPYDPPTPPPPTYMDQDTGSYCREYSQQTRIGGHTQESYGTACLQPDGSWKMQ